MDLNLKLSNVNNIDDINDARANKLVFIPIDQLVPNEINSKELKVDDSLKESIKEIGLNVPLDVIEIENNKYEISSGERRYTAFLSLIKENPDFTYKWKGNTEISPISKGIPCTVNRRTMSKEDKDLVRLIGNKSRDYDPLEQYNLFLSANSIYETKKANGEIVWGDGRKVEWLSMYLSVSQRTIQKMLDNSWIINSKNYEQIKEAGGYIEYQNSKAKPEVKSASQDNFEKEYKYLDKIQSHQEKLDFEKLSINDWQFEDLRKNAITTIQTIMERYGIQKKDIS